jgi:hypothetical protein
MVDVATRKGLFCDGKNAIAIIKPAGRRAGPEGRSQLNRRFGSITLGDDATDPSPCAGSRASLNQAQ